MKGGSSFRIFQSALTESWLFEGFGATSESDGGWMMGVGCVGGHSFRRLWGFDAAWWHNRCR